MNVIADTRKADRKIAEFKPRLRSAMENNARLTGRMAAFYCQQYTLPTDNKGGRWNFKKMEGRINADIENTYATKDDNGWEGAAYHLIMAHMSEEAAKSWYADFKRNPGGSFDPENPQNSAVDYETKFDRMRAIPRKVDDKEYLAYRKGNNYEVPGKRKSGHKLLGFVTPEKRKAFQNRRQKTKGLAKAGWKACFHALGGRGIGTETGLTGEKVQWPKEIGVPYRLFGGASLGTGTARATSQGFEGSVTNHVRHMDVAFPDHLKLNAAKWTKLYMKKIFDLKVKHGNLHKQRRAA